VGEENGVEGAIVFGFVLFEPKDFGGGVAWEHGVTGQFDEACGATELGFELAALVKGGRIAPEFSGSDDLAFFVEGHEAMLLAADADGLDFVPAFAQFFEAFADGCIDGVDPDLRFLFHVSLGEVWNQGVSARSGGEDGAGLKVKGDGFCALSAGIDAECDHVMEN
jgi:hypothetical protein